MMFNRLFMFCIVLIISQYAVVIHNAYSQSAMTQDQEFDILLKEVLLRFISFEVPNDVIDSVRGKTLEEIMLMFDSIIGRITGNGKNIFYGDRLEPENVLDIMDFPLDWWRTHSNIYGIMKSPDAEKREKGKEYLCKLVQAIVGVVPPESLPPDSKDLFKPISKEPRDDIPSITKPDIPTPPLPNLTWRYPVRELVTKPSFDESGLFELSAWRNTKKISWTRDTLFAVAAGGAAYILNRLSKSKFERNEDFAYHPSEGPKPIFWTATALGEPTWKRPLIPPGITLEEWRQRSDLQMWYPNPPIITIEVEDKPPRYIPVGRDVSIAISVGSASRVVYTLFRSKFFPIKNFPE